MQFLDRSSTIKAINHYGTNKTPFLFITSFNAQKNIVIPLDEINPSEIAYDFTIPLGDQKLSNAAEFKQTFANNTDPTKTPIWEKTPVDFATYERAFNPLLDALKSERVRLANLTFPTAIECNLSLEEIFTRTQAKYRIYLKDHFCSFSPETFVTIKNSTISTFPMKGTINALLPNAEQQLLDNPKELDEHELIAQQAIDDISLIADNARITRFRYLDKVNTHRGSILQTSSEISGDLPKDFHQNLGNILFDLLPASSITGAPRMETIQVLQEIETYQREFYTGIAGIFDGENLDSTVLIRYVEATDQPNQYVFKSGGGITRMSDAESEYNELIEKIYLPFS